MLYNFETNQNLEYISTPRGKRAQGPAGFRNIKIELSYQGAAFHGYQMQPHAKTVQYVINVAWEILTKEKVIIYGCSRLDAGVNASHFVLNLYSQTSLEPERIVQALNGILHVTLKESIRIYNAEIMYPTFNARFDSVGKHYRYLLWYGKGDHALLHANMWQVRTGKKMQNLAEHLVLFEGTHEFSAYRAHDCTSKTTVRTIFKVDPWVHPRIPELLVIDIWGEGFLKHMIRNIVGTCVDVALGKLPDNLIEESFIHGDRHKTGQCCPAHGLCLEKVYYDAAEMQADYTQGFKLLCI